MNQTKLNFFNQIYYAVTRPMKYFKLSKVSGGRLTGFVFLFVFFLSLFQIIPFLNTTVGPDGVVKYLHKDLPAFELSNGKLTVEKRYEITDAQTHIIVDTNVESFSSDDLDPSYSEEILISKTNMIDAQLGRTQIFDFSQFGAFHFDNSIVNKLMPLFYFVIVLMVIVIYLALVGAYFVSALLYSLVGLIVSVLDHMTLKYSVIFKTAIYAKVTAAILKAVISLIPVNIPDIFLSGLAILITCAYVVYGTLSHNSEEAKEDNTIDTPPQINY